MRDHSLLMIAKPFLAILLLANSFSAQAAGPVLPGAGSILQQINPAEHPSPSSTETGVNFELEEDDKLPALPPLQVQSIQITGNTQFDTVTLHGLVMDAEGQDLTSTQQAELASRITNYYHSHGYYMARAIILPRSVPDGRVVIRVIEARFGKVTVKNHSRVNDTLLRETLPTFKTLQNIELSALDRSMLLLSDIPGVVPNSTWKKPGAAAGIWDLEVDISSGPAVTGYVTLDNYGSVYTGRTRLGGTVNFINPLHHGDILSLYGLSSGREMHYGYISYESLLNGQGTRMGGAYSTLDYISGDSYASLNQHGTALVTSLWIRHPLTRSQTANSYGQLRYDLKQLRDHTDFFNSRWDRHLNNLTLLFYGDTQDTALSGGTNTWSTSMTLGQVDFDDPAAQQEDLTSLVTQGGFFKLTASLSRLQNLSPNNSLYLALSGQWAVVNLDASEKMLAGGPYTVRAYDVDVISGDTGYLGTAEFRHDLGQIWDGQWQAVGFIDTEHVTINKNTWTAGASATLSGAGVGLYWWSGSGQWNAKTYIAKPIGTTPQLLGSTASTRAWIEIGKEF